MDTGTFSPQQNVMPISVSRIANRFPNRFRSLAVRLVACLAVISGLTMPVLAQDQLQTKPLPSTPEFGSSDDSAVGDATEPVLIVTLASLNKLMQDVNYITGAVGQPQAGGIFAMLAGTFAQGLDMNEPIGVLVPLVDGLPQPIAIVPTADVKSVLKRLEAQTGGPADVLDDGTLVISFNATTIFIRQVGSWAALAPQKALLDLAPADPTGLFEGMGNEYDIAFRLKLQQVPAETRNMLVSQLRQGFEQAMQKQSGSNADQARDVAEGSMKQLEQFINETDELNFGLNIDQVARQVVIDTSFTAVDGTKLATLYGGSHAIPSQFGSVIRDDAAAYYHASTSISTEAIEQTRTTLRTTLNSVSGMLENEDGLSSSQAADIKELIDRVADLSLESIEEGQLDMGALLLTNNEDLRFVLGTFASDGNKAAQIVKDVAAKLENEPDAPRFEFDRSTYKGVAMHLVEADVPAKEDEARKVFGEKLQVHIGTGPKSVYVAIGANSETLMKELIDSKDSDSSADRPIGQFKLKLLPILEYANSIETNDVITAMIGELNRAADQGVISMVQSSIQNGQESKIRIGEGLLKAIGAAAQQAQQAKMQGQF